MRFAQAEWAGEAYKVITDPNNSASELYSNVFLQNTRCTKCRKKPRWEMHMKFVPLFGLAMITAIIVNKTFSIEHKPSSYVEEDM